MITDFFRTRAATAACAGLVLSALGILWLGNSTDVDLALADAAFDPISRTFPMQYAWLAETFNYVILKAVFIVAGALVIVLALFDAVLPSRQWRAAQRIGLRVVAMSAVLVPAAISLLKRASASHCPWDLAPYGGAQPCIRLLEWMPAGVEPGHCLPGGHASSALWLVAIAAFWWPNSREKAIAAGGAMLLLGGAVGWMQQLRGAHFFTHTFWSAWLACAIVLAIYLANTRLHFWLRSFVRRPLGVQGFQWNGADVRDQRTLRTAQATSGLVGEAVCADMEER